MFTLPVISAEILVNLEPAGIAVVEVFGGAPATVSRLFKLNATTPKASVVPVRTS